MDAMNRYVFTNTKQLPIRDARDKRFVCPYCNGDLSQIGFVGDDVVYIRCSNHPLCEYAPDHKKLTKLQNDLVRKIG
jgi:hypothetical protein